MTDSAGEKVFPSCSESDDGDALDGDTGTGTSDRLGYAASRADDAPKVETIRLGSIQATFRDGRIDHVSVRNILFELGYDSVCLSREDFVDIMHDVDPSNSGLDLDGLRELLQDFGEEVDMW